MFEIAVELCPLCEEELHSFGECAMQIWSEVVYRQIKGDTSHVFGEASGTGQSTIRFLEHKGFIITSETDYFWLKAKAIGLTEGEEGYALCKDKINHKFEE